MPIIPVIVLIQSYENSICRASVCLYIVPITAVCRMNSLVLGMNSHYTKIYFFYELYNKYRCIFSL